jgi:putative flippase GtrA
MSDSKTAILLKSSFVRFLAVGILNTLIGLSVSYILFNAAGVDYWIATFGGNTVGAVVSYFLNRRFTFRSTVSVGSSWWKFAAVIIVCYFASYGLALWLSDALNWLMPDISLRFQHNVAILLGTGLYTIMNYFGHKYFTFRRSG